MAGKSPRISTNAPWRARIVNHGLTIKIKLNPNAKGIF
jgi:hypothetical protein